MSNSLPHNLVQDLLCPITMTWLEDPVCVQCCQKAFSREALRTALQHSDRCPLCNGEVGDIDTLIVSRMLEGLVASARASEQSTIAASVVVNSPKKNIWKAQYTPVSDKYGRLSVSITESTYAVDPVLFILLVDTSGSMSGRPIEQVRQSLKHIYDISCLNSQIILRVILYNSNATELDLSHDAHARISSIGANGGTLFLCAFQKMCDIIVREKQKNVSIAFLTDGQDGGNKSSADMSREFRQMLKDIEVSSLTLHSIGFGSECNKILLEDLRKIGTQEGTFRYAEPQDSDDALCHKIAGVFNISCSGAQLKLSLKINEKTHEDHISVSTRNTGRLFYWSEPCTEIVLHVCGESITLDVETVEDPEVTEAFLRRQVDMLAADILACSEQKTDADLLQLKCALFRKTASMLNFPETEILLKQIDHLAAGQSIDIARLADLKFSSMFGGGLVREPHVKSITAPKQAALEAIVESPLKHQHYLDVDKLLENRNIEAKDSNGNNLIILLSYGGMFWELDKILQQHSLDINHMNNFGETAFTIAIKRRGYDKTLGILLNHGANVIRRDSLIRFAIDNGYMRTAKILDGLSNSDSVYLDKDMKLDYMFFLHERLLSMANKPPEMYQNHFDIFLSRVIENPEAIIPKLISMIPHVQLTVDHLIEHSIANKPDSPHIPVYLETAKMLLSAKPDLLHCKNADQETPLFAACKRGSLPHVQLFIQRDSHQQFESRNDKGNTPLWIATYMRFPCIIEYLLDNGANIHCCNDKGNGVLSGVCERGGIKVAELLLARGADLSIINHNGDTLILLSSRNGQHEILKLLLNYVDEEFVGYRAAIDGFNAIMASAEANRPECIRVLHEFGVSLEETTADDNAILKRSTPLHIAAYYGRLEAVEMLLRLGCNGNARDMFGNTALHIAAMQGYGAIIKALLPHVDQGCLNHDGQPAMAYSQDPTLFLDPLCDVLTTLAQGRFSAETEALAILGSYLSDPARLSISLNICDTYGFTPLMYAVIYSRPAVVELLVRLGVNRNTVRRNLTAGFWGKYLRNMKIGRLLDLPPIDPIVARIQAMPKSDMLFLGLPVPMCRQSTLCQRMILRKVEGSQGRFPAILGSVNISQLVKPETLWTAKIAAITALVDIDIPVPEALVLSTYSTSMDLYNIFAQEDLRNPSPAAILFHTALLALPVYTGELYLGLPEVDRKAFAVGQRFCTSSFTSCSTMWRVALRNAPSFDKKSRTGVVFIIKNSGARLINRFSLFAGDSEAIILPFSSFTVKAWYHGDVIALGQENIRAHSFAVEEVTKDGWQTYAEMQENNKSLIIEIEGSQ